MTAPFTGNRPGAQPGLPNLPEPPSGWPVGSYAKYEEAQRAVDHLADNEFPVADVTIVGVNLMLVERVIGRLTWGRVLLTGAASGAWLGLFVGLVLSLFAPVGSGFGSTSPAWSSASSSASCPGRSPTAPPAAGGTSPRRARSWPGATTSCASPATPRRPGTC